MYELSKADLLGSILNETQPATRTIIKTSEQEESADLVSYLQKHGLDEFQVVRREFFAHTAEPAITFNDYKFYVNMASLQRFPDTSSIQVLINQKRKILAILPCPANAKDSFVWCSIKKDGKRQPRHLSCKLFFAKINELMGWNPAHRYKLLGTQVRANGENLLVFDLTATETYQRIEAEGQKKKNVRLPVFPEEWKDQFGLPFNEHRKAMQVNIIDGYAVYSVLDPAKDTRSSLPTNAVTSEC